MEEAQNQSPVVTQDVSQPQENKVSFPTVGGEKKNGGAKTLLIIGILVLVGVLGYVIYRSASGNGATELAEPTPFDNMVASESDSESTTSPEPTSSPSATVDKESIKVQVQNGTGITGEAAYLQNILKGLGYTDVSVGNSASQDATDTTVSFGSSVPSEVVNEITSKLNSVYEKVTKSSAAGSTYDIVVVTGLRKGATPKPTSTPAD